MDNSSKTHNIPLLSSHHYFTNQYRPIPSIDLRRNIRPFLLIEQYLLRHISCSLYLLLTLLSAWEQNECFQMNRLSFVYLHKRREAFTVFPMFWRGLILHRFISFTWVSNDFTCGFVPVLLYDIMLCSLTV